MKPSVVTITGTASEHALFVELHQIENQENKSAGVSKVMFNTHENYINPRFLNFSAAFTRNDMQISGLWV
jgi:hypothetical protein